MSVADSKEYGKRLTFIEQEAYNAKAKTTCLGACPSVLPYLPKQSRWPWPGPISGALNKCQTGLFSSRRFV